MVVIYTPQTRPFKGEHDGGDGADVHVGACRCLQADRERKPGHMLIRCRDDGTAEGANREGGLVSWVWRERKRFSKSDRGRKTEE